MRALLIANAADCDPGFVGERLRHHGFAFTECHREQPSEWPALDGVELVLALGSDWSVYWDHVAASVGAEAALLRDAARRGVPVFGICFGNQVAAHAFGGSVHKGARHELGWFDVGSSVPQHLADGPWFQWHGDVVDVPPGATVLARNELCPQAWQLGRTLATQFHPEVNDAIVARWLREGAGEARALGHDPEQVLELTRQRVVVSRPACERLVDWFLDV
jgi:GMP synthase-like glutamine amidotransferase